MLKMIFFFRNFFEGILNEWLNTHPNEIFSLASDHQLLHGRNFELFYWRVAHRHLITD